MTLGRQIFAALAFTVVSSALVYAVCFALPKTYESEQVLLFPNSPTTGNSLAAQFFNSGGNQPGDAVSFGGPGSISSPLIGSSSVVAMGILESRTCREYVVEKLGLEARWRMSKQKAVAELKRQGKVRQDDNGFVVITGQSNDAELARNIASAMFEYLDKGAKNLTRNISRRNRETIEARLRVSKAEADRARLALVKTAVNSPLVDKAAISGLLTGGLQKLGEARAAMKSAEGKVSAYSAMVERALTKGDEVGSLQAVGGGTVDAALQKLAEELQTRRIEFETVQQVYTVDSPEYKLARDKVTSGRKAVAETVKEARASLKGDRFAPMIPVQSELAGLRQSVKIFEESLDEYRRLALRAPQDAALVQMRESQFQTALRTWQSLEFQLAQAVINEERDPARYEVVDEAVVNPEPVAPRKGLITGAWFLGSLALCTWFILRKRIRFVE